MASLFNTQGMLEQMTDIAKKATRETIVPTIKHFSVDAAMYMHEAAVIANEDANETKIQVGEGTQSKIHSIETLLSTLFTSMKKCPAFGQVVIMILLIRNGNAVDKLVSAFLREFLNKRNKRRLSLLLASAFFSYFVAGVLPPLLKARRKVLAGKEAERETREAERLADIVPINEDDQEVKGEVGIGLHKGSRNHMEDRVLVEENVQPGVRLMAVIDGHGGSEAANLVQGALVKAVKKGGSWPFHSKKLLTGRFHELFQDLESQLLEHLPKRGETNSSGLSSGCVLNVSLQRGSRLFFANLGDCQIFNEPLEGHGVVTALTGDNTAHHPEAPAERERITQAGAALDADGTIHGLAVSRCLGDFWLADWTKPAGLSILPDVSIYSLETTALLVLCTDGVTSSPGNALAVVRKSLRAGDASPKDAATALADAEAAKEGSDNVGIIAVMLHRPAPSARQAPKRLFLGRGSSSSGSGGFKLDFSVSKEETTKKKGEK